MQCIVLIIDLIGFVRLQKKSKFHLSPDYKRAPLHNLHCIKSIFYKPTRFALRSFADLQNSHFEKRKFLKSYMNKWNNFHTELL